MISQRERGELARFYTVTDPKKHQKGYTVYKVTARIISRKSPEDVQEITVWKRYSDFRKLHQNLWQLHKNLCSQSELFPPFAKAKVFGRFDDSVIEERRQCSEDLLQFSANIPALYSSQHIEDFFKGGEVHDGSELIGPAESFSDFLADSLSDCSSEVQRDFSGADDITVTSEYGGPSSDSDLTSLAVDTDSLAGLDDHGMASGRTSPNQPPGGAASSSSIIIGSGNCSPLLPSLHARPSPASSPSVPRVPAASSSSSSSSTPNPEVSGAGGRSANRATLFSSAGLKRVVVAAGANLGKEPKWDYLDRASERIRLALQKETERDYQAALGYYRSGVDLLLQGVQGEPSPTRREAVKKRTAEYLMRAEQISNQHLRSNMGQGSTQTVAMGAQCCPPSSRGGQQSPADELRAYRVLGVIDKVLLVMDKRTQETFILKGLRKSSDCGKPKRTVMPHTVPNMVQLKKFVVSEDTVFLLLQYAEGGKLWSHIGKFLRSYSPDESFDIPFIQKSHTAAVHSPQHATPSQPGQGSAGSGSGSGAGAGSGSAPGGQGAAHLLAFPRKKKGPLPPGLTESLGARSDSGATSEEECTNSYLTLCNEYEQEREEPDDALEGEAAAQGGGGEGEKSGREALSPDAPVAAAAAAATVATSSSRTRSLVSNDSLSSPLSSQELCFFTESSDGNGSRYRGDGQDNGEVFSPLPSPAAPLSLDQSKRTPMEFFRIDSKDSASEVTICPDSCEPRPSCPPKPLLPAAFSTPDPGSSSEEVAEDLPELAREVKSHGGPEDPGGDKDSNESVAVISFKEAVVEDEGQPPDLLVNLPLVTDGAADSLEEELESSSGVCLGLEVTASPQKKSTHQPDVLQLHSQPEEGAGEQQPPSPAEREVPKARAVSAPCGEISHKSPSSPSPCVWLNYSLAFGQEADAEVDRACQNKDPLPDNNAISIPPPSIVAMPVTDSSSESREPGMSLKDADLVNPEPSGVNVDSISATPHRAEACTGIERILCLDAELCGDNSNTNTNGSEYDKEVSRLFAELDRLSLAASQARIPEEFVRSWAVEMVLALDGLHQEGIVCRDLNPNNILLNHQGHVQLTYFCSWSEVEESYDQDAIANMYCAPEVGGIGEETTACDWWSLGAILFELLTGKSLLHCHPAGISRHTALNIPECVSEEAGSLLEQLLQYNPVERLGSGVAGVDDIKSHPFFSRVDWLK